MVDITATIAEPEEITVTLSGEGTSWGSINGTLSNQIDLQAALDAKVTGPSSAVDNAIATFDLTTGKLIQDSGLIGEDGKIYQSGFPNSYIKFNSGTIEIWAGGVIQAAWS